MQIPNACGLAEYKGCADTPPMIFGEEFTFIFSRFPCVLEERKNVCGSGVNLRAEWGEPAPRSALAADF